jgi:hypothetical protein
MTKVAFKKLAFSNDLPQIDGNDNVFSLGITFSEMPGEMPG